MTQMILALCVIAAVAPLAPAFGFFSDFLDGDASGNAVYEDFALHPEAIYDSESGKTIVAYQGIGMNPFVAAYDQDAKTWDPPVQVGVNPLDSDAHGGPSLVIDNDGYIHVFYGAHGGYLLHARSASPHDPTAWEDLGKLSVTQVSGETTRAVNVLATYPQPSLESSGSIRLFYRSFVKDDTYGDWYSVTSTSGVGTWSQPEVALMGEPGEEGWYADFVRDEDTNDTYAGFLLRDLAANQTDYFVRRNVYFMRRDAATGTWFNAAGESVPDTRTLEYMDQTCLVWDSGDAWVNQVVVEPTPDGPALMFVTGSELPEPAYEWRFIRWSSADSTWSAAVTIAETDNLFDAGCLEVLDDGTIDAYITVGGYPDENALLSEAKLAARGGDIARYRLAVGDDEFKLDKALISSPGPWARYNDPQVVRGHNGGPRVFFSEWNNDFANYVHKVFLWGDAGFAQREFTPESERLAGDTRVGTAVEVSKEAFPSGSNYVVIASRDNFPDALCGAPLAHSLRAPVLLTRPQSLDTSVTEEIRRLWGSDRTPDEMKAVVLGSEAAISADVYRQLQSLLGSKNVSRLGGNNRYETSIKIQQKLATLRGAPKTVVLASGQNFPDALAISPIAARKNMPILLTDPATLTAATAGAIASIGASSTIIVGGPAAVSESVEASVASLTPDPVPLRLGGDDRWETAHIIVEYGLDNGLSLERFVVCTGENFPDALTGGVLAARMNAPLLITETDRLTSQTAAIVLSRPHTLRWYVLGSDVAVAPSVQNQIAAYLPK